MGLLDGMLGNASKVDAAKIQQEFSQILAPGSRSSMRISSSGIILCSPTAAWSSSTSRD